MSSNAFLLFCFSRGDSESSNSAGGRGGVLYGSGGYDDDSGSRAASQPPMTPDAPEEPLLTEQDHRELLSLLNQNISMDFILEMKEAFQLFDKVSLEKIGSYLADCVNKLELSLVLNSLKTRRTTWASLRVDHKRLAVKLKLCFPPLLLLIDFQRRQRLYF